MSLLNKASSLKKEAELILRESKLIEVLMRFGTPTFTGSYQYNLMTSRDIDVYLVEEKLDKTDVKNLVSKLIDQGYWNRIKYADFFNFTHPTDDNLNGSFYVGLKRGHGEGEWKVDICIVTKDQEAKLDYPWLKNISEQQRDEILEAKFNKEISGLTSFEIYKKVLLE